MNVLVTGGAGYIGGHVVLALLQEGHAVTVLDDLSSGYRENVSPRAEFIRGDILDAGPVEEALSRRIEAVIHLAALKAAGESMIAPEKYARTNICGSLNILNAACARGVRFFVFSSSAAVYGEPEYLPLDESHPCRPENYYGFTKYLIEQNLPWYDLARGMKYAALRYFNAAGYDAEGRVRGLESNPENLIPVIMEAAAGFRDRLMIFGEDYDTRDGTGLRDYIHVSDLARAHVAALEYIRNNDRSLTVNLGSDRGATVREVLDAARRVTGRPIPAQVAPRRNGDLSSLIASSRYAEKCLGWKPVESDLDVMLSTTWRVYRESPQFRAKAAPA